MSLFSQQPLAAAVRASVFAGGVAIITAPAHAGFEENTTTNPFDVITSGTVTPSLVLQDFDSDGDLDAVVFHDDHQDVLPFDGTDTSFYENTGTAANPEFTQVADQSGYGGQGDNFDVNPFAYDWTYSSYGHPVTAGDLDGDGDADIFGGTNTSSVSMLVGVTNTDAYGVATGLNALFHYPGYTPVSSPYYGQVLLPYLESNVGYAGFYGGGVPLDLDNDDDMDLIVADDRFVRVYQNNGVVEGVVQLDELTAGNHPFYAGAASNANLGISEGVVQLTDSAYYGAPLAVGDVDNDGDLDVVMGVRTGPANMRLFLNTGSSSVAVFEEQTDATLNVATDIFAAPVMADVDGDMDDDLVVAEQNATGNASYRLFVNDGEAPESNSAAVARSSGGGAMGALMAVVSLIVLRRRRR